MPLPGSTRIRWTRRSGACERRKARWPRVSRRYSGTVALLVKVAPLALSLVIARVQAQSVPFEVRSYPGTPMAFAVEPVRTVRLGPDRRQFVAVKNISGTTTTSLLFQQSLAGESK